MNLRDTTVIVKTFERPDLLDRLLVSVRRFYPDVPVLVADDSLKPVDHPLATRTFRMPHDSGLPAGRNLLLREVDTPYLVTCDDDFVFRADTRLEMLTAVLDADPAIDLVAGHADDGNRAWRVWDGRKPEERHGCLLVDYVRNFFAARTDSIMDLGGWSEATKIGGEHEDFFRRAKAAGMVVAWHPAVKVGHYRKSTDRAQQAHYHLWRHREGEGAAADRPSVVVVGNGSSLTGRGLGPGIDQHQYVVRVNDYRLADQQHDAGSRTTHWMLCCSPDVIQRFSDPRDCSDLRELWLMARKANHRIVDQARERFPAPRVETIWHLEHRFPRFIRWKRDVERIRVPRCGNAVRPTTGLFAIAQALDRWGPPVHLAGFDPAATYYWGGAVPARLHNLQAEAELIDDWQAAGLVRRLDGR